MVKTRKNLESAFAGESQANLKYLIFSEKAEKEGEKRIAHLFRAVANAEKVHARNHLKVMQGVNTTSENLLASIAGEHHEFTNMYPSYINQAENEDEGKAARSFKLANKVEEVHHTLYTDALKGLRTNRTAELKPFYVCQVCGYTIEGETPDKCPICEAPQKMFQLIE